MHRVLIVHTEYQKVVQGLLNMTYGMNDNNSEKIFHQFSIKTYVVGTHEKRISESQRKIMLFWKSFV